MNKLFRIIVCLGVIGFFFPVRPDVPVWGAERELESGQANHIIEQMYGKLSPQPLTVKFSANAVRVGESIWMTVSGGTEPYVLITVENKIEVAPRGKNTYQITGLVSGDSGLTVGDSKNNMVTKVIAVLPRK